MQPIVLSDILAAGEVPALDQVALLAKAGFKAIINNQPDGEVERLPSSAALAAEAARCGLAYLYAPITSRTPSPEELLRFSRALEVLPSPIYAACYSGARSAAATAFVLTAEKNPDTIIAEFAAAGFDIAALAPWLCELREIHAPGAMAAAARAEAAIKPAQAARTPIAAPAHTETPRGPAAAAQATPAGIVVLARPRGAGGFAMVHYPH